MKPAGANVNGKPLLAKDAKVPASHPVKKRC
jgi:hypothetical protein